MKNVFMDLFGFIYTLSMGDYFFFIGTFLLIVLFIYIVYLIKSSDEVIETPKLKDDFDLEAVSKAIEKDYKPEVIRLTSWEDEQEKTAVISYEELIKNAQAQTAKYDDSFSFESEELSVKKFDLTNTSEIPVIDESKINVSLMSYEKEEDFLKALKELQSNLVR